jgi:hypothetical protein
MTKTASALFAFAAVWAAIPAVAGNMSADEAQRFVVDKLFSFTCFEGTSGEGRVHADGSVEGTIRLGGSGAAYHATLPSGTLRIRGKVVCAAISGIPFEPCFDLDRTGAKSFRGSLAAMRFAFCQFTKTPDHPEMGSTSLPLSILPAATGSSRH